MVMLSFYVVKQYYQSNYNRMTVIYLVKKLFTWFIVAKLNTVVNYYDIFTQENVDLNLQQ